MLKFRSLQVPRLDHTLTHLAGQAFSMNQFLCILLHHFVYPMGSNALIQFTSWALPFLFQLSALRQ
jgi:hypothetical protein